MALLKLKNLHVALEDGTEIVKGVELAVDTNEIHAIMGPNGSGKSTLAYALMGHPAYEISEGEVLFDGTEITELGADEREQLDPQGARRAGGPDPDPAVPEGALRGDGPAQGLARARVSLPQRRLLGRREEARRDPADGDAAAEDRRPR